MKKMCDTFQEKKANCEMTQTLKLADKDFKVGIIIMLYELDKMFY